MDELLALFRYDHLTGDARKAGEACAKLAHAVAKLPAGGEQVAALRQLLNVRELVLRAASAVQPIPASQPKDEARV